MSAEQIQNQLQNKSWIRRNWMLYLCPICSPRGNTVQIGFSKYENGIYKLNWGTVINPFTFRPKKVWDTHLHPWYESHGRKSKCIKPKWTGTAMAVVAMANAKTAKQMVVCRTAGGKIMTNVVIYWKWLRGKYLAITHLVQTNWAQHTIEKSLHFFTLKKPFFVIFDNKQKSTIHRIPSRPM